MIEMEPTAYVRVIFCSYKQKAPPHDAGGLFMMGRVSLYVMPVSRFAEPLPEARSLVLCGCIW
jgi:hypothetical protein